MSSPSSVLTRGLGAWGSPSLLLTRGLGDYGISQSGPLVGQWDNVAYFATGLQSPAFATGSIRNIFKTGHDQNNLEATDAHNH